MEEVVLVDEHNNEIGTAPKDTVHTKNTPLHRGFSVFLFNAKNQVLLSKRAATKKTFPGVWTNAVCGHPSQGETVETAALRRLRDELGYSTVSVRKVSDYRYRFADAKGIVENEICPILVGYTNDDPNINTDEVEEWKWMDWKEFLSTLTLQSSGYSPWSVEEAKIIEKLQLTRPA